MVRWLVSCPFAFEPTPARVLSPRTRLSFVFILYSYLYYYYSYCQIITITIIVIITTIVIINIMIIITLIIILIILLIILIVIMCFFLGGNPLLDLGAAPREAQRHGCKSLPICPPVSSVLMPIPSG